MTFKTTLVFILSRLEKIISKIDMYLIKKITNIMLK